jgi:8-oxo-dGTP diphosphatase
MELLATLTDEQLGMQSPEFSKKETRTAVRAVLIDADGRVTIINVEKNSYNKIPGGGVEQGEDYEQTLLREIREEAGCEATIDCEVGEIIEERAAYGLYQRSLCYIARVKEKGIPMYEQSEIDEGFSIGWHDMNEAITIFERTKPTEYSARFMHTRDHIFLKHAAELLR